MVGRHPRIPKATPLHESTYMTASVPGRPASRTARTSISWVSWPLLVLGVFGFAAAWVTLGIYNGSQNSWMAVLGALDIAWMLRLGGWPRGPARVAAALFATIAIVVLANWGIIAAQLGAMLGLMPWASALKLGFHHAWTLAQLANGAGDVAWLLLALLVAAVTAR